MHIPEETRDVAHWSHNEWPDVITPATKPPLGVMPEHIHCIRRFDDLARAIYEYRLAGLTPNHEWVNELFRIYAMSFNDPK